MHSIGARRLTWIVLAVAGLALAYLFQNLDLLTVVCQCQFHPYTHFAARKVFRVVLNDTFMLLIIHAWFFDRKITTIAWYVQIVDMFILLPVYLLIKLQVEEDSEISSPLLSQFHRLIVNPTLMVLIIPAVYYQRLTQRNTI